MVSLGSIEGTGDFFQWNADTGLYEWPGYLGESPYLANYSLEPVKTEQRADGVLLDFGRELSGRLVLKAAPKEQSVTVRFGESMGELLHAPRMGDVPLYAPVGIEARGPKSAFRYALISSNGDAANEKVYAEGIYYPVKYAGSFESSDARLNRIWEVSAYTAHLCMQDSIWDGVKRDRGRWIGDQEVIDRVVGDVFGDGRLVRDELAQDVGKGPLDDHVNGLPGYSAWWVVSEAEYLRRWGNIAAVREQKTHLLEVLARMDAELDARGVYVAASGRKPFVDWSKGFSADSPEARRATDFEYILAYRNAAWLLRQLGDSTEAAKQDARADAMTAAAQKYLSEGATFGDRWQTNAIAVLAGATATPAQRDAAWSDVLSRTVKGRKSTDVITPYYGDYVLNAMADAGQAARGSGVDAQLLGRHAGRGRDEFLGGVGSGVGRRRSAREAAGGRQGWLQRESRAWMGGGAGGLADGRGARSEGAGAGLQARTDTARPRGAWVGKGRSGDSAGRGGCRCSRGALCRDDSCRYGG